MLARIILGASAVVALGLFAVVLVAARSRNADLLNETLPYLLGSMLLFNGCYIAVHWAFRPESLFGTRVSVSWTNLKTLSRPFQRAFFILGLFMIACGILVRSPWMSPVPSWRRVTGILGGAFFLYIGSMHYLPKYRRLRTEQAEDQKQGPV